MKKLLLLLVILMVPALVIGTWWNMNQTNRVTEYEAVDEAETADSATSSMYASMKGDVFDKAYLADMIAHHQGALNMAGWAINQTTKPEIKALANTILSTQSTEVQQMIAWQQEWGGTASDSSNPHAGHISEMSSAMSADMAAMQEKLVGLTGEAYDKEFLAQMILHHQQAVDMSKYAESNADRQEIKDLARRIISSQEKEIADMKSWQLRWGY